ncbi:MAG TPA: mechanosensitive ion channel family protein [Flavobacterium sp.]|jgi:small conductance mechanosensitive channel
MKQHLTDRLNEIIPWLLHSGIAIFLILLIAYLLNRIACGFISRTVRIAVRSKYFQTEAAERQRENTLTHIFSWTTTILIMVVALLMVLEQLGIAIGPVLASVGIVGLALGFGGQYLIRDIISGLFIILENQYRIGDWVAFDGTEGEVTDITLRMTTLRDMDGTAHHVPHGEIKKVSNMSKDYAKINLDVRIAYESDLEKVIDVVNNIGKAIAEDPEWKQHIINPPEFLRVSDFEDSAMVIKIVGDTQPLQQWAITGELRKRIKIQFDNSGIIIPYPQRVIHQRNHNDRGKECT